MEDEAYNDAIGYDEEDVDVEDDGDISVIGLPPPLPIPRSVSAQLSKFPKKVTTWALKVS